MEMKKFIVTRMNAGAQTVEAETYHFETSAPFVTFTKTVGQRKEMVASFNTSGLVKIVEESQTPA